ncbi:hypothetical protein FE773_03090 [Caminibacter mediatlanticus TB-2]|uniref:Uncharacterized protein n=1 Tax=Caminibacter mediatlanticus TB-2 TaxID=391592 RepID=A0AAI9F209_9BACT|nr:hypothetical protein [Caminibacter mediatlanticus]EDM23270.1 hypothetical protein CMTB2_06216 [Caminibacter mediatlanticus TB-2]QCT94196.1 hypothetical protein FE773_03090 [Caminibacter mediatlanticus TB-2]
MSLIHNITWINQNMQIVSAVASDYVAREVVSKEFQKVLNEEKERKVEEIKEVEKIEEILPDDDEKRIIEKDAQKHIDIKA